ncbi:hypothetical protein M422DRAFT_245275 [Sphaerobolus stellatus SS14]|nr:hypothetical protein M422DRAFT_245275 [Sphaerobolus stellatus SS14]
MSVHSSPNPVATQGSVSSHDHILDSLDITCFESGGNLWPLTITNDDNICLDSFDLFQEPIPGLTISNPSNIQGTPPMVESLNDSSFIFKQSSRASIDVHLMPMGASSSMLDDFEPNSTPHTVRISLDAEPRVQSDEASSSGSINIQPPESTNTHNHHGIIPPKRPEERDPMKYISIIPARDGKPLFKCCWHGCPGVTFWDKNEVTQHVHEHFIKKPHECVCGTTFNTKTSARRHCREQGKKNTCPGWRVPPFSDYSDRVLTAIDSLRAYTRKTYLNVHMKECKGKKPSTNRA